MHDQAGSGRTDAPDTVLIALPIPPRELNPNERPHWAAKSRATAKYRAIAKGVGLGQLKGFLPRWQKAVIDIEWHHGRRGRLPDKLNVTSWLKAGIDGLTDAGLFRDDQGVESGSITVLRVDRGCEPIVYLHVIGCDAPDGPADPVPVRHDR